MIFEIVSAIIGLMVVLAVPGYLMSLLLFRALSRIERLVLAIGLSIVLVVFLGFFLSTISFVTGMKMITKTSVWISLIAVSLFFAILILLRPKQRR